MKTDIVENVRHFQFVKYCFELSDGLFGRLDFIPSNSYRAEIHPRRQLFSTSIPPASFITFGDLKVSHGFSLLC